MDINNNYSVKDETKDWNTMCKMLESLSNREDPTDFKQKCLTLCQKYLSGDWSKLNANDVEIKRLMGGMMNIVYHCKIPINLQDNGIEPKEVILRIYGLIDFKTMERTDNTLDDNLKFLLLSENGVGPKVYGVAKTGIIMKFYKHRLFNESDLADKSLFDQLAIKLARFHSMRPPIETKSNTKNMMLSMSRYLEENYSLKRKSIEESNCKSLLDFNFKSETEWILNKIQSFSSPLVFSHSDFRFGNIMVTEEEGIIIADYDSSSYFYRGFDFATFFYEFIKIGETSYEFKDECVVRDFIGKYLAECGLINGKQYSDNKINSIEHILKEIKVFTLVYTMLCINILMTNKELWRFPIDDNTIWDIVVSEVKKYLALKKLLGDF